MKNLLESKGCFKAGNLFAMSLLLIGTTSLAQPLAGSLGIDELRCNEMNQDHPESIKSQNVVFDFDKAGECTMNHGIGKNGDPVVVVKYDVTYPSPDLVVLKGKEVVRTGLDDLIEEIDGVHGHEALKALKDELLNSKFASVEYRFVQNQDHWEFKTEKDPYFCDDNGSTLRLSVRE